jgi:hypothetical protein
MWFLTELEKNFCFKNGEMGLSEYWHKDHKQSDSNHKTRSSFHNNSSLWLKSSTSRCRESPALPARLNAKLI